MLKRIIIKLQWVGFLFYFPRKNKLLRLFVRIGLKLIFHWFVQTFIFRKSLLLLDTDKFILSNTDTRGAPVSILGYEDNSSFNTTLYFLRVKKLVRVLTTLTVPFYFNLKIKLLCHTSKKKLNMSMSTDQTSWPSWKDL